MILDEYDDYGEMPALSTSDSESKDWDTDENTPIADIILKEKKNDAAGDVHTIDHAY